MKFIHFIMQICLLIRTRKSTSLSMEKFDFVLISYRIYEFVYVQEISIIGERVTCLTN